MRYRVLVVLPKQEPLMESALAFKERRASTIPLIVTRMPGRVQIDVASTAIPLGTARLEQMTMEAVRPEASERFAVRGFVEAESREAIPKESDGHTLFADPEIQPFPTCGNSPAVGDAALVKSKLNVPALAAKRLDGTDVAIAIMDTGINLAHLTAKLGVGVRLDAANSWTRTGTTIAPGKHPVDHGTMCAYDALIAAPKATLLDFPILGSGMPGGAPMAGSLGVACRQAWMYSSASAR